MAKHSRKEMRQRRHRRLRRRIHGTAERPRMAVCTTAKHVYVQFVDDDRGHTLLGLSTLAKEAREAGIRGTVEGARQLGQLAAEKALEAGIQAAVFDRGGFRYHGRVKSLAEGARATNLKL